MDPKVVSLNTWQQPNGAVIHSFYVKRMSDGATTLLYQTPLVGSNLPGTGLEWSPTSHQILQHTSDGSGIFVLYADSPGRKKEHGPFRVGRTSPRIPSSPINSTRRFVNNGQGYAFALTREIVPSRGPPPRNITLP